QQLAENSIFNPIGGILLPTSTPVLVLLHLIYVPKAVPIRGPTPPPLPSGREVLVLNQVFLC
ncbi:MAG: hypothetical protein AAFU67_08240, partial [Bacteroidota bacterium]